MDARTSSTTGATRTTGDGVLFVDDEPRILKALTRICRGEGYAIRTAETAEKALRILESEPVTVVVSDQQMPGTQGTALLARVREQFPDTLRILLTGNTEMQVAVAAINHGEVYRLLTKPWNDDELRATLRQALETHHMRREIERLDVLTREQNVELQQLNRGLEERVRERTQQVKQKHADLRRAYIETVRALAEAVDAKDSYTRGHSERVAVYAARLAERLGESRTFVERLYLAGLLHDIGKIGVPDAILGKPGKLTREEYARMQDHPEIGARILEPVSFLADVVPGVRHHHEWYDGSARGYPDRLRGSHIPYPSRILLVADTVEAMTSDRPYRRARSMDAVCDEIERFKGSQLDPRVADCFLEMADHEGEGFLQRTSKFDLECFLGEIGDRT